VQIAQIYERLLSPNGKIWVDRVAAHSPLL